ncbi:MAG TPA: hypothetical protein VL984_02590 [Acidimicrobiales bacterium]|nr:hypothetical protein [Acidimicrobiales bacterium]
MLHIGLAATKAPWSSALRAYVRDHGQGLEVDVVMDGAALRKCLARTDILVIDDVMRVFSAADIAKARDAGVHVIGLSDPSDGNGRQYLLALGADEVAEATTAPSELVALFAGARPRSRAKANSRDFNDWRTAARARAAAKGRRGTLSAWAKVSGGAGLSELVVAAAENLSRRARVLVVEADELAPVLVSRLLRSPEGGLQWGLARARQGLASLPEALSGPRGDGASVVGHFDAVCAPSGAGQAVSPSHLEKLLDEATEAYDHVLVETSWLVGTAPSRERPGLAGPVVNRAAAVVVVAAADPEGAARLVQWKASALATGLAAPCWAAFGRARAGGFERSQLGALLEANTGRHPFAGVAFLPEDRAVARARWNADLVARGPWKKAVDELVTAVVSSLGRPRGRAPEPSADGHGTSGARLWRPLARRAVTT